MKTKMNQKAFRLSLARRVHMCAKLSRYCIVHFKELGATRSWWISYLMKKDDETLLMYEAECFIRNETSDEHDIEKLDLGFLDDIAPSEEEVDELK